MKELGGNYVLPFRFQREQDKKTSHFLVFVTKHPKGYGIMKDIMASESSLAEQGVPSFSYFPADKATPLLFALTRKLDDLEDELPRRFAGKSLTMREIVDKHHIDTPYIEKNYRAVLNKLEVNGRIVCEPPAQKRPTRNGERTFAERTLVKFPSS
jgi:hypothetical protein